MKRNILFFLCLWLALGEAVAQELTVKSMAAAPMDLSASQYERKDFNGQACGLVKVQLAAAGAQFEGNVIGQVEYKTGVGMAAGSATRGAVAWRFGAATRLATATTTSACALPFSESSQKKRKKEKKEIGTRPPSGLCVKGGPKAAKRAKP